MFFVAVFLLLSGGFFCLQLTRPIECSVYKEVIGHGNRGGSKLLKRSRYVREYKLSIQLRTVIEGPW